MQAVVEATLLTFSTRAVADGALLFSAWLEVILQRRHCRIKDWRYSQAVQVCDFFFAMNGWCVLCGVRGKRGRDAFGLKGARCELPLPTADA